MLLGSWGLFLKKKLQRATLKNMEQCFNLCFNQNLQTGQKIPRNLGLVASQQEMFYLLIQITGVTLLFAPYFILLRAFWKSFEATMTYPCPGGRVGIKCPNLWTFTLVTLLITWRVPQKPVGSFMQTDRYGWRKNSWVLSTDVPLFLLFLFETESIGLMESFIQVTYLDKRKVCSFLLQQDYFTVKGQLASATTKPFILICGIIKILELSECKTIFLA